MWSQKRWLVSCEGLMRSSRCRTVPSNHSPIWRLLVGATQRLMAAIRMYSPTLTPCRRLETWRLRISTTPKRRAIAYRAATAPKSNTLAATGLAAWLLSSFVRMSSSLPRYCAP